MEQNERESDAPKEHVKGRRREYLIGYLGFRGQLRSILTVALTWRVSLGHSFF